MSSKRVVHVHLSNLSNTTKDSAGYLDRVQLDVLECLHPAPHHRRQSLQVHSHWAEVGVALKIRLI